MNLLWIFLGGLWIVIWIFEALLILLFGLRQKNILHQGGNYLPHQTQWMVEKPLVSATGETLTLPDPFSRRTAFIHRLCTLRFPGYSVMLQEHSKNRAYSLNSEQLKRGAEQAYLCWLLESPFKLFRWSIKLEDPLDFWVYPAMSKAEIPYVLPSAGSDLSQNYSSVSTQEFYESRKYHPGDDPRKINWKHYARTGDLHVRIDEKGLPRHREIYCVLDPCSDEKELDRQISQFRGALEDAGLNGEDQYLWVPAENRWLDVKDEMQSCLKALAAWTEEDCSLPESLQSGRLLIFSYSGSERLRQWKNYFSQQDMTIGYYRPEEHSSIALWKQLLFRRGWHE